MKGDVQQAVLDLFDFGDGLEPTDQAIGQCDTPGLNANNAGIAEITMILNELVSKSVKDEVELFFREDNPSGHRSANIAVGFRRHFLIFHQSAYLSQMEQEVREMSSRRYGFWLIVAIAGLTAAFQTSLAQGIELFNASFEGEPQDATVPQGWIACKEGTTPDILPGFWGVYTEPNDGETYVGLITRHNNTWESIGQRLTAPLVKDRCYEWSLDIAHSDTYSGYNGPIRLRVYIGKLKCQKDQLIYESPLIEHLDWKTYSFKFTPVEECRYILLEAFHSEEPFEYQGNILLDRLRAIRPCDKT